VQLFDIVGEEDGGIILFNKIRRQNRVGDAVVGENDGDLLGDLLG
jgi:hypothetical protein